MNYDTIKKNYLSGLWSLTMVKMAYKRGIITLDEYKDIKSSKEE